MSIKNIIFIAGILFCSWNAVGQSKVFVLNAAALQKNKERIQQKDAALFTAYKKLLKDADKELSFGPVSVIEKKNDPPSGNKHDYMSLAPYFWPDPAKKDGLPYIRKDGQTNPEVKDYKDKEYLPRLCDAVNTLSLAYYFSGDKKYAAHAAKLLQVWFIDTATKMNPNLNYAQAMKGHNTGRGAGMIDTRHFLKVIDAIGLLQGSSYWAASNQKAMQAWFREYLHWMQTSKNGVEEMNAKNNHGSFYDAQRLSVALFLDSADLAKKVIIHAAERLDKQMDDKGQFPLEMERTIALHYTTFVMEALFNIAAMSEKTTIDFWNYKTPTGKSLQKGFDELKPYLTQQKKWEGQQIKSFEFEEGFPILIDGYRKYNCNDCLKAVRTISGDDTEKLRLRLLTDTDL